MLVQARPYLVIQHYKISTWLCVKTPLIPILVSIAIRAISIKLEDVSCCSSSLSELTAAARDDFLSHRSYLNMLSLMTEGGSVGEHSIRQLCNNYVLIFLLKKS